MKKSNQLIFLIVILGLVSCSDDTQVPNQSLAEFQVEYSQEGNLEKFVKSFEIGSGFIDESSGLDSPSTLLEDDLKMADYSFITKSDKPSIHLSITAGWLPTAGAPASMTSTVTVYRNGQLLDTNSFITTNDDVSSIHTLDYTAQ